ncbi:hypothetical protein B0H14DRAFT_3879323 [Mycena olivaceomarginata]|nr:hypothetical protein B0H14DRAFT_3879323 [Mycena olivaceomarginata]
MAGIELLAPELLLEIMFMLHDSIGQKFIIAQVSQLWRDVALHSHLFWSSFTGDSKADYRRLPLMWNAADFMMAQRTDALTALVAYVARIEHSTRCFLLQRYGSALLWLGVSRSPTLPLESLGRNNEPTLLFTAPQLRTLEVDAADLKNWATFLSPSLESVRLWGSILELCPRVSRIAMKLWDRLYSNETEDPFEALSRPFALALGELELELFEDPELVRVLHTGFSDVVLHTLKGRIYNGHGEENVELLADALLLSVGPLLDFKLDMQDVELHDEVGHVLRLQCWNDDSSFEVGEVWKHLSFHYNLYITVREIRIHAEHWRDYLEVFESYPPQLEDGITLAIDTSRGEFPQIQDDEGDFLLAPPFPPPPRRPPLPASKHFSISRTQYILCAPPHNPCCAAFTCPSPPAALSPLARRPRFLRDTRAPHKYNQPRVACITIAPSCSHFRASLGCLRRHACLTLSMQFIFLPPASSIPCLLVEPPPPSACCSAIIIYCLLLAPLSPRHAEVPGDTQVDGPRATRTRLRG